MPTALELSREEWKRYAEAASRRSGQGSIRPEEQAARDRLLTQVQQAAQLLKAQFRVRRVVLFGSLSHAAWFTPGSDVDLAVEGLSAKDYFRAWRKVEDVIGERSVDLVDLDDVSDSLRLAIERHGRDL